MAKSVPNSICLAYKKTILARKVYTYFHATFHNQNVVVFYRQAYIPSIIKKAP